MKHSKAYPINLMCRLLNVSRSGYYEFCHRKESLRSITNKELSSKIQEIFVKSNSTYGSLRVQKTLLQRGKRLSRAKVARLMKSLSLRSVWKKKYKPQTTVVDAKAKYSPNLVDRDFRANAVGSKVGSDITYIRTSEGWLYLAVIIDFFSRKILGYAFSNSLESTIVCEAFVKAVGKYGHLENSVYHSDRGRQYTSETYRKLLESMNITQSMSRKGNCWDNAVAESFFSSLKKERIKRRIYASRQASQVKCV